jgi:arsenate reductase
MLIDRRRLTAEFLGTLILVLGVVGSGIMAANLSPNDVGLQLLQNALATAGVLFVIITIFMPVSGASFNPIVTLAATAFGDFDRREVLPYVVVQSLGGATGAILANVLFDLDAAQWATKDRDASHLLISEVIASIGLLIVIFALARTKREALIAPSVACYIGAAYYFTSSTSFANPAVTIGRMFSDTFAGIAPASAPLFIVMQLVGLVLAVPLIKFLWPSDN